MEFHLHFWQTSTVKMRSEMRSTFRFRNIHQTFETRDFQPRHIRPRGTGRQPADGLSLILLIFLRKFVHYTEFGSNLIYITDDLPKVKYGFWYNWFISYVCFWWWLPYMVNLS